MRSHDHLGRALLQRRDQILHHLWSILAVAFKKHNPVQAAINCVLISFPLVAPIYEIGLISID
jgi:hypothetical protein